jgi:DNA polymerase (family 10)
MDNREISTLFDTIADLLEIKGESVYKVLAYRRVSESVRSLTQDVEAMWREGQLREIPGVGEAIGEKLDELLQTGRLGFYDRLAEEVPAGLVDVLRVSDVGPKKAARFWKELGITNLEQLEASARQGKLRELPGMGERSEARILQGIESLRRRASDRASIGVALPAAMDLAGRLRQVEGVVAVELAGSLRRRRETIGDIDLVVSSAAPAKIMASFTTMPEVKRILGQGETKASVELANGLRAQLWIHPPERFGTALQYATGSQSHNVRLRELAQTQGLSLSEHGFKLPGEHPDFLCAEEEQVYQALGLDWIPPELREDRGEISAAREGRLPRLVAEEDIRGELHAHTDWSDGTAPMQAMAEAAIAAGLQYLVISDHSQSLGVANGLTAERLMAQRRLLRDVQAAVGDRLRLLHGIEVEILADGRLDFPDDVLAGLDVVTASLHSSLRQSREKATARLLAAIRNPHVDIIGHPTGRMIGSRDGADLDMERILGEACERGVILELNAHPDRLDLDEVHCRRLIELGGLLAINTDAHGVDGFGLRRFGVGIARRGWVTAASVANTWPVERLLAHLAA